MGAREMQQLRRVVAAADALLGAREAEQVTSAEWDGLAAAVDEYRTTADAGGSDRFTRDAGDALVRHVTPRRGTPYDHRCERQVFEAVAYRVEEMAGYAFTLEDLREREDVPWTQASVALAFLKERGLVERVGRKNVGAPGFTSEDAMVELLALGVDP